MISMTEIKAKIITGLARLKGQWENAQSEKQSAISPNKEVQIANKKKLIVIFCSFIAIVLIVFSFSMKKEKEPAEKINDKKEESTFTTPVSDVDEQSVWLERAENKLQNEQRNTSTLKKMFTKQSEQMNAQQSMVEEQQSTISALSNKIDELETKLEEIKADDAGKQPNAVEDNINELGTASQSQSESDMQSFTLSLAPKNSHSIDDYRSYKNYVPAATYVKGVIIGGVDSSAAVTSQSDPRPVLIRFVSKGSLPNNYFSQLKNCKALGAAYGDLSSERVYIRLETLSCVREGRPYDFQVDGYVAGPDNKVGVRGKVIMRDAKLIGLAGVGGFMSGFADSLSDKYTTTSISPLGATSTLNNGDSLKYGGAQGASNASDMLGQYFIKRAEQLQPVVEIGGGTVIDVVFIKGFYLDGQSEELHKKENEPQDISNLSYPATTNVANQDNPMSNNTQAQDISSQVEALSRTSQTGSAQHEMNQEQSAVRAFP